MTTLRQLVIQAQALGGEHPCTVLDHQWSSVGGRACPHEEQCPSLKSCSQAVYQCVRCEEYDYGERGGPGHADCVRYCGLPE